MKEFILAMGRDFLYMGNEYHIQVGGEAKKVGLAVLPSFASMSC